MDSITSVATRVKTSKKPKQRSLSYNAQVGSLHLKVDGKETGYWLDAQQHDFGPSFRCYRVSKIAKPEDETYDVTIGPDSASCECLGFLRWSRCKHVDSLRALLTLKKLS